MAVKTDLKKQISGCYYLIKSNYEALLENAGTTE